LLCGGGEVQKFEKYLELTEHIQRMARTGRAGNAIEWSDFLSLLNAALEDECKREAPCERFCEATAFKSEIKRLRRAIRRFCQGSEWAADSWKQQPHINELFYIDAQ
jgi:hypothetical protein